MGRLVVASFATLSFACASAVPPAATPTPSTDGAEASVSVDAHGRRWRLADTGGRWTLVVQQEARVLATQVLLPSCEPGRLALDPLDLGRGVAAVQARIGEWFAIVEFVEDARLEVQVGASTCREGSPFRVRASQSNGRFDVEEVTRGATRVFRWLPFEGGFEYIPSRPRSPEVWRVSATSSMPPQGDLDFSPAAAVDGIAETAWAAEFTESGAPPRLTVDLGLRRRVTAIELVPGCGADEAAWAMNPRLARVRLLGRDSHRAFDVPDLPFRGRHRIAWDSEVKTLTLEAQQVHGLGKVACISELRVHAEPIQPQQSLEPVLVALFDLSCADAWSAWASARGHDPAKRSVTRGAIELWRSADTDHLASATLECFDADVQDPICSAQVAEILARFGEPASPQRAPNTLVYRWPGGVGEIEWDEDGRTPVAVSLRCAHPRLKGHER